MIASQSSSMYVGTKTEVFNLNFVPIFLKIF